MVIKVKGKITIYNKTKNKIELEKCNVVTLNGKNLIADRLINDNSGYIDYLAIGNGSGTHDDTSTELFNEIFRKQITSKSSPGNKIVLKTDILSDEAVGNWTEIGLFNSSTGGVMSNVVNISYNHNVGDDVEVRWEIEIS